VSVNRRLVIGALLILLFPLLVTHALCYMAAASMLEDRALSQLESVASMQKKRVAAIIAQNGERLRLVSSRTQLRLNLAAFLAGHDGEQQAKMNKILQDARDSIPCFQDISVLDLEGTVVASTDPEQVGRTLKGEEAFTKGGRGVCDDLLSLDDTGRLMFLLAGPLMLEGRPLGVVVIRADADTLVSLARDYSGLGETGETILVARTEAGAVLCLTPLRFDETAALTKSVPGDRDTSPLVQAILGNARLHADGIDYRGERVIAASESIERPGWGLVVKVDRSEALAPVAKLRTISLVVAACSAAAVVLIALWFSRTITGPISNLTHVARRMRDGDLSAEIRATSSDEIGELGRSIDEMRRKLGTSLRRLEKETTRRVEVQEALKTTSKRADAILAAVPDIIMEVDENKVYTWANDAGLEFFGQDCIGREAAHYFEGQQDTYQAGQPLFKGDENVLYVESWQRRRDGERRLLAWWCRVLKDADGSVAGALSTARDITDHRKAGEALMRLSRARLTLGEVNRALTQATDERGLLQSVCNILVQSGGYRIAWVGLAERYEAKTVTPVAHAGDAAGFLDLVNSTWREGESARCVAGTAIATGRAEIARSISECPDENLCREEAAKRGCEACIALPLMSERGRVGVVCIYTEDADAFDADEVDLLSELADDVAFGVAGVRAHVGRRKAEEALDESEQRLLRLMSNLPGMAYRCRNDRDWTMEFVSDGCQDLTGYLPVDLIDGRNISYNDLINPEDRDRVREEVQSGLKAKRPFQIEYRIRTASGDEKWGWEQGVGVFAEDGELEALEGFIGDVTERRQSEEALRVSESALKQAQQLAGIGTWEWDIDSDQHTWSEEIYHIYGRDPALPPAAYPEVRQYFTADSWACLAAAVEKGLAEGVPYECDAQVVRPDGSRRWITARGQAVRDTCGSVVNLHGTVQDITNRKRAEESLREAEARYRAIFDGAAEGILVADVETRQFRYAHPAACQLLGYTEEELMRISVADIHPSDSLRHVISEFEAQARGEKTLATEIPCLRKDASIVYADITTASAVIGGHKCNVGFFVDVTRRRELEAQFNQAQRLEAVGRLAGGVAHDFNNMLSAIIGYADLLLMTVKEDNPARGDLESIRNSADRAAGLTRQLLAFSRKQTLQPRVLNLNDVVADLEKMLRRLIGEDVDLVCVPGSGLGQVKADPGQIEQVVMNLAINARDAMPDGGKLTIETANVELDEEYAKVHVDVSAGPHVMLAVTDTGSGMDEETREQIFEPFFTTKEHGKGTGLGLSTVYGIVKQSGGNIWAYSEVGRGTTFKVYLPRVDEPAEKLARAGPVEAPVGGSETVLVVEDEREVRELVTRVLRLGGYTVLEAADGEEALGIAEGHEGDIQLVVTDVIMPRMSAKELSEKIAECRPATKVLFTSGYTDNSVVHQGVLDPDIPFIQKPYTVSSLLAKVREVLDPGGRQEDVGRP